MLSKNIINGMAGTERLCTDVCMHTVRLTSGQQNSHGFQSAKSRTGNVGVTSKPGPTKPGPRKPRVRVRVGLVLGFLSVPILSVPVLSVPVLTGNRECCSR